MKKCPYCNRAYSDMVKMCSICGTDLSGSAAANRAQNVRSSTVVEQKNDTKVVTGQVVQTPAQNNSVDSGNILWGVLGFCFPIVGWILAAKWKYTKPQTAKIANTCAWIGFAVGMLATLASM